MKNKLNALAKCWNNDYRHKGTRKRSLSRYADQTQENSIFNVISPINYHYS